MTRQRRKGQPVAVANLLVELAAGTPLEQRLREARVWELWETAVGPQIARQARPAGFRDGVLTVTVATAPWMQQLALLKPQVLAKLNGTLGEELVRDLRFRAGRLTPPVAEAKDVAPRRTPSPAEEARIADATATLVDAELRQAMAELLASQLPDYAGED